MKLPKHTYLYIVIALILGGFFLVLFNRAYIDSRIEEYCAIQGKSGICFSESSYDGLLQDLKDEMFVGLEAGTLYLDSDKQIRTVIKENLSPVEGDKLEEDGVDSIDSNPVNGVTYTETSNNIWNLIGNSVVLVDSTSRVGIGVSSPGFKLEVAGNVGPSKDNTYKLGNDTDRWGSVTTGEGGLKLVNTYTNSSDYQMGGVSYGSYFYSIPGQSLDILSNSDSDFSYEELKSGASSYVASGKDIMLNSGVEGKVKRGCRISLNSSFYDINSVLDSQNITLLSAPAVTSGTVEHVYCNSVDIENGLTLNRDLITKPADLDTFAIAFQDTDPSSNDSKLSTFAYASGIETYFTGGYFRDENYDYRAAIYTSIDSETWTRQLLPSTEFADSGVRSVIYEESSEKILVGGYDYIDGEYAFVVWESVNGQDWTEHIVEPMASDWDGPQMLIYDETNSRYLFGALYYGGSQYQFDIWESTDLITWTNHNAHNFDYYPNITTFIYSKERGEYVFGGYYRTSTYRRATVWASTDLENWTQHEIEDNTSGNTRVTRLIYVSEEDKYVGIGWDLTSDSIVWESADLISWTKRDFSSGGSTYYNASIVYNPLDSSYLIGGSMDDPINGWRAAIWHSYDLINWEERYVSPIGMDSKVNNLMYDELHGMYLGSGIAYDRPDRAVIWASDPGTVWAYPDTNYYSATLSENVDISDWFSITGVTITESLNSEELSYSFSFDGTDTWGILLPGETVWRSIVRNNNGTWQYNSALDYGAETWLNSSINTKESSLSEAFAISSNRMSSTDISAITASRWEYTGGFTQNREEMNVAIGFKTENNQVSPCMHSIQFAYDDSRGGSAVTIASKASAGNEIAPIQFVVGDNDKAMFISEEGLVGIGTNSPDGLFDVAGKFVVDESGNAFIAGDLVADGDAHIGGILNENSSLLIGGNVGIGTTSPSYALDVSGQINASEGICVSDECWNELPIIPYIYSEETGISTFSGGLMVGGTDIGITEDGNIVNARAYTGNEMLLQKGGNFGLDSDLILTGQGLGSSVGSGDFNSDGLTDVLVRQSNGVKIYRSMESGGFSLDDNYYYLAGSGNIAVGDINGDGHLDFASANQNANNLQVYLNNGDGTFADVVTYSTGFQSTYIGIGEVNGDIHQDIVLRNYGTNSISVLINNGDGTFGPHTEYATVNSYTANVIVADLNNDNYGDIVVGNDTYGTQSVFLNNGDGTFPSRADYSVGYKTRDVSAADIDLDGDLDLVAANAGANYVSVLKNRGNGTFDYKVNYTLDGATDRGAEEVEFKDVTNDGYPDILYVNYTASKFGVYVNNGDGTFGNRLDYPTPGYVDSFSLGDTNGDGVDDAVLFDNTNRNVLVYLGLGNGQFDSYSNLYPFIYTRGGYLDDIDKDGFSDFVTINDPDDTLSVYINDGKGGFSSDEHENYSAEGPYILKSNDVNNDGYLDSVVINSDSESISIFINNTDGTFSNKVNYSITGYPDDLALGDINGDGYNDIMTMKTYPDEYSILLNNGDGTFGSETSFPVTERLRDILLKDVNGDGYVDFVFANDSIYGIHVSINDEIGNFGTPTLYSSTSRINQIVIEDLDGDGLQDMVATTSSSIVVFLNDKNESFKLPKYYAASLWAYAIAVDDFDGDNKKDVVISQSDTYYPKIAVFKNLGEGNFSSPEYYSVSSTPSYIILGDITGDHMSDIITSSYYEGINVFENNLKPMFYAQASTGFIGIGTVTPGSELDVKGVLRISGATSGYVGFSVVDGSEDITYQLPSADGASGEFLQTDGNGHLIWSQVPNTFSEDLFVGGDIVSGGLYTGNITSNSIFSNGSIYADGSLTVQSISNYSSYSGGSMLLESAGILDSSILVNYSGNNFAPLELEDFNHDGLLDYAAPSTYPTDYVSIFYAQGNGASFNRVDYPAASDPTRIGVGDLNGDTESDIVVTNQNGASFSVYINNGDGVLADKVDYATDATPIALGLDDVNNDGLDDVFVTYNSSTVLSVFLNNGDGTFGARVDYTVGYRPKSIKFGDFNKDGYLDVVTANYYNNNASVLINNGDGTFSSKVDYTAGSYPSSIEVGELNRDGYLDIVVTNSSSDNVSVLFNNGDGTFAAKVDYAAGDSPNSVAIEDLDGDTLNDLIVVNSSSDNVSILKNNGDGTFAEKIDYFAGDAPNVVKVGDLFNDGTLDLFISNSSYVYILQNNGDGTFKSKVDYAAGSYPMSVDMGDMNGDKYKDFATVRNDGTSNMSVFLSNTDGTYSPKVDYQTDTQPKGVAVGDLNNDGKDDIVTANFGDDSVSVFYNNGDGTFASKIDYSIRFHGYSVRIADINNDGNMDIIAVAGYYFSVLMNNGAGGFSRTDDYSLSGNSSNALDVTDVDGDGFKDVLMAAQGADAMVVYLNNGSGSFGEPIPYTSGHTPREISSGDINGDSHLDVVVTNYNSETLSLFINNGDGTFADKIDYETGIGPQGVSVKDINKDGLGDVIVVNNGSNSISVYSGINGGRLGNRVDYVVGLNPYFVSTGDIDADGSIDAVVTNMGDNTISILKNSIDSMFYADAVTQFVGIGTTSPEAKLDVAGTMQILGDFTSNNTLVESGNSEDATLTGTCAGEVNTANQLVFKSDIWIDSSSVVYNSNRSHHSRISNISACVDDLSDRYVIVSLQDPITGNVAGDAFSIYDTTSNIGDGVGGFFNTVYAVEFKGLTSTLSGGFDIAEQYQTDDETIEAGDVVSIYSDEMLLVSDTKVEKSVVESDSKVLGVVSTNPGLTLGGETEGNWVKVALAGRVPVKVSTVNGQIEAGDFLTSSAESGKAVKAIRSGMVIGRALEDFVCPEGEELMCEGTVLMFVDSMWYSPNSLEYSVTPDSANSINLQSGLAAINAGEIRIVVSYSSPFDSIPVLTVSAKKNTISYEIVEESESGFTIQVTTPVEENTLFTWIAVPRTEDAISE